MPNPFGSGYQSPFGGSNPYLPSASGSGNPFVAPGSTTKKKKKKKKELTARQALILMKALEAEKEKDLSFGDVLKAGGKGALGGATWALDKIMRPSYATVAAVSEALGGESDIEGADNPLEAAWKGLKGDVKKGFGQILEEQGVLEGHRRLRGLAGFGLDVVTDPTMLASVAAAPFTGGGSIAAYTAAKTGGRAVTKEVLEGAAREAGERVLKGETDDILEEILKQGGKKYQHRLGLLNQNKAFENLEPEQIFGLGNQGIQATERGIHIGQRMASAEARVYNPRKIELRYGFGTHTLRVPTPIPVITRPGAKLAEKEIPVLSTLSNGLGQAFIPGFRNDIFNAGKLARQQAGEFNAVVARDEAVRIFAGVEDKLTPDQMRDALHYFEQPLQRGKGHWKAVEKYKATDLTAHVTGKPERFRLNEKYIQKLVDEGKIDEDQLDFVRKYFAFTNYLNAGDQSVGLRYKNFGESGRMYVPHATRPDVDDVNVALTSLLTKAGFEHGRDAQMSLRQIKEAIDAGDMEDVFELDPMKALVMRSRAGAERQADMGLINTLKSSVGIQTRIVDPKRVGRAQARLDAAAAKHEASQRVAAAAEQTLDARVAQVEQELTNVYEAAKLNMAKKSPQVARTLKEQRVKELENEIAKLKKGTQPKAGRAATTAKAVESVAEEAPKAPTGYEGFLEREVEQIKNIAQARKELDVLDKRKAPGEELPALFRAAKQHIKGTRNATRRDNARAYLDRWEMRLLKKRKNRLAAQAEKATSVAEKVPKTKRGAKAPAAPAKPVEKVTTQRSLRTGKPWHANVMRGTRKMGSVFRDGEGDAAEWVALAKDGTELGRYPTRKMAVSRVDLVTRPKVAKAAPKPKAKGKGKAAKAAATPTPPKPKVDRKKIKELQAEIEKVKKGRFTAQAKAQTEKDILDLDEKYAAAMEALSKPRSRAAAKLLGEEHTTLKAAKEVMRDAKLEVRKAQNSVYKATKGRPNKQFNEMAHYTSKEVDEFGNPWAFPKEAKETILRLERLVSGEDKAVKDFAKGWGKFMSAWKIAMTTVNPGYRLRNSATDYWNMWVAGVPSYRIAEYGVKAAKVMADMKAVDDPGRYIKAFRQIQEASDHGILSGLFAGDIQEVSQMFLHAQKSRRYLAKNGRYIALATKVAQDMNRNAENWGRLTHYLYRRNVLKETADEAAMRVKIAHFDYEDITEFEKKLKKYAFPFYTWTRKNIPYQVRQIMARPGRYSAFPKMAQEAEYATGEGEGSSVPGYVSENFGFRIPFGEAGTYFMPQFGVSDLAALEGPGGIENRVRSLLGPQLKMPAELLTGKSIFTGQDIAPENHTRVPFGGGIVGALGGDAGGLLDLIPGTDVGPTSRTGPDDTMVEGEGINPWAAWAIGQVPMARALTGIGANTPQRQRNQMLSYLGGVSVQNVDPKMQAYYDRLKVEETVDRIISELRDEGSYPRSDRKRTDFEKTIENILKGNY